MYSFLPADDSMDSMDVVNVIFANRKVIENLAGRRLPHIAPPDETMGCPWSKYKEMGF